MKINFFNRDNVLFPFRWFIIIFICVAGFMLYADLTGMRILSFSDGQQWNSRGPGYHK